MVWLSSQVKVESRDVRLACVERPSYSSFRTSLERRSAAELRTAMTIYLFSFYTKVCEFLEVDRVRNGACSSHSLRLKCGPNNGHWSQANSTPFTAQKYYVYDSGRGLSSRGL